MESADAQQPAPLGDPRVDVVHQVDLGRRLLTGALGDIVKVRWRDGGRTREVTGILDSRDGYGLRYTDSSVEGAPPIVALGTAIGALRGVIVDYLWLKVNMMKEDGEFYEVMSDAELITKLQPRFAQVWGFHGHNMAYNISVATHTSEERWDWVNKGIRLLREQGIPYNPRAVRLYRELSWIFFHKIGQYSDDAHWFYKRELAYEMQQVLGDLDRGGTTEQVITRFKAIADAPAPLTTIFTSLIFFLVISSALINAAVVMIAVPC